MRITFLGCGGSGGVPLVGGKDEKGYWGVCDPKEPRNHRTRSSVVIELNSGKRLLIDTGPDLRTQLLREGIGCIHAVIYSHAHADHIAGMDEIRSINRVIGKPMPVYATHDTFQELKARFSYAFKPWTSAPQFFRPVLELHEINYQDEFLIQGQLIKTCEQEHGFGKSIGIRCGSIAYCTDVVSISCENLAILAGVEVFVVGCFQRTEHPAHAWIDRVMEWQTVIQPKRTILTHMGPDMDWSWLQSNLPENIEVAYDGFITYSS